MPSWVIALLLLAGLAMGADRAIQISDPRLQGFGELLRCVQCLRDGEWTARMHDVEELEKQILAEAARKRAAEGAAS